MTTHFALGNLQAGIIYAAENIAGFLPFGSLLGKGRKFLHNSVDIIFGCNNKNGV
jgi:hypothetical protein